MSNRDMYHLELNREKIQGARIVLLPGDPARSPVIAGKIAEQYGMPKPQRPLAYNREFCTYLVTVKGEPVLVTSTGIGGPSTAIAVDELAQLGVQTFIRVGTTGAIQDGIAIGDIVITSGSVRLDGASTQYAPIEYPAVAHHEVLAALIEAAKSLIPALRCRAHVGITCSTDTFYQAQERTDSFARYIPRRFQGMTEEWRRLRVLNYEMESATLLTMCNALGLRGGCVTGVIGSRTTEEPITPEALKLGQDHAIAVASKAVELLIKQG
jgi:uridine phosphorylase